MPYSEFENIEVEVFDRYGRFLWSGRGTLDAANGEGWNGTNQNGEALPSGDYWYHILVNDSEGREYTGSFTLFRMN